MAVGPSLIGPPLRARCARREIPADDSLDIRNAELEFVLATAREMGLERIIFGHASIIRVRLRSASSHDARMSVEPSSLPPLICLVSALGWCCESSRVAWHLEVIDRRCAPISTGLERAPGVSCIGN